MMKRILVAYDGSAPADKAYAFALDLAKKYGADIHVIAVARPPDFGDDVETAAILENSVKHYDKDIGAAESPGCISRAQPALQGSRGTPGGTNHIPRGRVQS